MGFGMTREVVKFVYVYESSEWNDLNIKGLVRWSVEVASEIL